MTFVIASPPCCSWSSYSRPIFIIIILYYIILYYIILYLFLFWSIGAPHARHGAHGLYYLYYLYIFILFILLYLFCSSFEAHTVSIILTL